MTLVKDRESCQGGGTGLVERATDRNSVSEQSPDERRGIAPLLFNRPLLPTPSLYSVPRTGVKREMCCAARISIAEIIR